MARAIAFHDFEIEKICRAVRGERGSGGGGGGGSSTSATRPTPGDLSLPLWTSEVTALLRVQPILHSLFFDLELATAAVLAASRGKQHNKQFGGYGLRAMTYLTCAFFTTPVTKATMRTTTMVITVTAYNNNSATTTNTPAC